MINWVRVRVTVTVTVTVNVGVRVRVRVRAKGSGLGFGERSCKSALIVPCCLFYSKGKIGTGKIDDISASCVSMTVRLHLPPPPPSPVTLILALPKPKAFSPILESLAVLGYKRIHIIATARVSPSHPPMTPYPECIHVAINAFNLQTPVPSKMPRRAENVVL
jgi:hypothetical protein